MDFFDILLSKTLSGGGGGGGGSSDLSTAEVTVSGTDYINSIYGAWLTNVEGLGTIMIYGMGGEDITSPLTIAVADGGSVIEIDAMGSSINVSGNITSVGDDSYLVTGDCTITISDGGGT